MTFLILVLLSKQDQNSLVQYLNFNFKKRFCFLWCIKMVSSMTKWEEKYKIVAPFWLYTKTYSLLRSVKASKNFGISHCIAGNYNNENCCSLIFFPITLIKVLGFIDQFHLHTIASLILNLCLSAFGTRNIFCHFQQTK